MAENKNEEVKKETSVDTEKLKNETANTVNQVKDTIKNVNIKQDSVDTKNFVVEMFTKPVEKIRETVKDKEGNTLKYALILLSVWALVGFLKLVFAGTLNLPAGAALWAIIKALAVPFLEVAIMGVIILLCCSKDTKKSLTTIVTAVTIAKVPVIISSVVTMLNYASVDAYKITSPVASFFSAISTVLLFFVIKFLLNKKDEESIKTFAIVEILYLAVAFVLGFLGIYI